MSKENVYLDYNATTPLAQTVYDIICKTLKNNWANPSSGYSLGLNAKKCIDEARCHIANMLQASSSSIIFTSCGTESSNMAISSVVTHMKKHFTVIPHIITSTVEHDATIKVLESLSGIEVTQVRPQNGTITAQSIIDEIKHETCLITIMAANNETGTIFPVAEISKMLESINTTRRLESLCHIYLHTDAAQIVGKLALNIKNTKADYISFTGHKFYGPRIGCLYFNKNAPVYPLIFGGGQEHGFRPGTENTALIAGFGEAARLVNENVDEYCKHMTYMRNYLQEKLSEVFPEEEIVFNFTDVNRLPNTLSVSFSNKNAQELLKACKIVNASTGSACHSSLKTVSRVVKEFLPENLWLGTVRLSVGRETSTSDIDRAVEDLWSAFLKTGSY